MSFLKQQISKYRFKFESNIHTILYNLCNTYNYYL